MTIDSLDVLLFLFGTSLLFHVQFQLLLPDLHTDFSRGRSGGLVFPSLSEFPTEFLTQSNFRLFYYLRAQDSPSRTALIAERRKTSSHLKREDYERCVLGRTPLEANLRRPLERGVAHMHLNEGPVLIQEELEDLY